jgi:glycosyltransferase involved in cell wall biosynthesis
MIKLSVCIPVWNQQDLVLRAIDHIPRRDDIEVLVRDDGSTDGTLSNLLDYKDRHPELKMSVYRNPENKGMYYTLNRLLEDAKGEYFHCHNSDDCVDTEVYNRLIDRLQGIDVLGFDLCINNGEVWKLTPETNRIHCAQAIRFIRKGFVDQYGITYREELKAASDYYYNEEMLKHNPTIVYSGEVCYLYNFPREGSLVNLRAKGIIGE